MSWFAGIFGERSNALDRTLDVLTYFALGVVWLLALLAFAMTRGNVIVGILVLVTAALVTRAVAQWDEVKRYRT